MSKTTEINLSFESKCECGQVHKQILTIQDCDLDIDYPVTPIAMNPQSWSVPVVSARATARFNGGISALNVEGIELKDGWLLCVKCGKGEPLLWDANTKAGEG